MKKYIRSAVLALVMAISISGSVSAAPFTLLSQGVKSMLSAKAMHITGTMTMQSYANTEPSMLSVFGLDSGKMTISFDSHFDGLITGKEKVMQNISLSGGMLGNFSVESRMDGDTGYIKVPGQLLALITQGNTETDTWVRISKEDIASLDKTFPGIKEMYGEIEKYNSKQNSFVTKNQGEWAQFSQAVSLQPIGQRVIEGKSVAAYSMKLNKKTLRSNMISYYKTKHGSAMNTYMVKALDDSLATSQLKNGVFAFWPNTKLPYSVNGTLETIDPKTKKILSSTDFKFLFKDYNTPLVFNAPSSYITATEAFNTWFKDAVEGSSEKGKAAQIKATMANFRMYAELFFDENGNKFGSKANSSSCTSASSGSLFNSTGTYGDDIKKAIDGAKAMGAKDMKCTSSTTAYAWSVKLPTNEYYCVDSMGNAGTISRKHSGTQCK